MSNQQIILAYQGEMALKGQNRRTFEAIVMKTLKRRLKGLALFDISKAQSTFFIRPLSSCDMEQALQRVATTFGISAVSLCFVTAKAYEQIKDTVFSKLNEPLLNATTFKVISKRADKSFPLNSMELSAQLGGDILGQYPHISVDVKQPQQVVFVEVRDTAAYVHSGKQLAVGGLPVSSSGRAALLLSGGIDSPVAAYMMAKRGLSLVAVHFCSPPYTSARAKEKVLTLAEKLTLYTGDLPLYIVSYASVQEYLRDNGVQELFTVLMRRSMLRITETLTKKHGAEAIITGESLAQVASQTLKALDCTDKACEMLVLRPLIGMDKIEITAIARRIDTFETSILPYEDCCTIFTPAHPKTRPNITEILQAEAAMTELFSLEQQAAENAEIIYKQL